MTILIMRRMRKRTVSPTTKRYRCEFPGCGELAEPNSYRCKGHQVKHKQVRVRQETDRFYTCKAWKMLSKEMLEKQPLCAEHERHGIHIMADHVDHIIPYKQRPDLALDRSNLEPLCRPCHGRKSIAEGLHAQ